MTIILSRCGFRCDLCLAYKPNLLEHPEEAQKLSDGWFKYFGFRIPPEKIMCAGCLADTIETLDKGCPVRPCVIAHAIDTCAHCPDYVCEKLADRLITFEEMQARFSEPITPTEREAFIFPYENKARLDAMHSP